MTMNKLQARIVILEDALIQAQHTVEFLHGCLTDDHYRYEYPEQTVRRLREWAILVPAPEGCAHSVHKSDCESCVAHVAYQARMIEARMTEKATPG